MNQGEKLKHLIKLKGFTQDTFAAELGYSHRSAYTPYFKYEKIPPDFLKKALKALDMSESEFQSNELFIMTESKKRNVHSELEIDALNDIIREKDVAIRAQENAIDAQKISIQVMQQRIEDLENMIALLKLKTSK